MKLPVRHLAARYLWVQREVENQSVSVEKVAGQRNPADLGTKHVDVKVMEFCRDFVGLKAAHMDEQEEQETKNTVNNIFTGLMLLPTIKRHNILKLLMTASTLATAKGYEMRSVGINDESFVRFLRWTSDSGDCFTDGVVDTWMDGGRYEYLEIMPIIPSCEKSTKIDD